MAWSETNHLRRPSSCQVWCQAPSTHLLLGGAAPVAQRGQPCLMGTLGLPQGWGKLRPGQTLAQGAAVPGAMALLQGTPSQGSQPEQQLSRSVSSV